MFQLDTKTRKSIYEQVVDNLKELIMSEALTSGEKLLSVRDLSKEITVNPNTVQKAYKQLETEGYIYTVSGIGTFVSDKTNIKIDTNKINEIKLNIQFYFKELIYLGLSAEEAKMLILDATKERGTGNDKSK